MSFNLQIHPSAIEKIKNVILENNHSKNSGLRINITAGGCSGFNTSFAIEEQEKEEDVIIQQDGIRIFINNQVANLIQNAELKFNSSIMNSYFSLDVKTATDKCSCGSSFNL